MYRFPNVLSKRRSAALSLLASEPGRAFFDYVTSHLPGATLAAGDGHAVIVYPGLGAGAWSTARLRNALDTAGFKTVDWGFGSNHGPRGSADGWLREMQTALEDVAKAHGRKVSLVGWSLGGIYARELARAAPANVRQVVTLGSPFAAPLETPQAQWLNPFLAGSRSTHARRDRERLRRPPPVPSTSIYSKADGVVPWRSCIQGRGAKAENIEVAGVSHLGMGANRTVMAIVADRLAQPEGGWRRYRR